MKYNAKTFKNAKFRGVKNAHIIFVGNNHNGMNLYNNNLGGGTDQLYQL